MTLTIQALLTMGIAFNTISIWMCIKNRMRHSRRLNDLELELLRLDFQILILRREYGTGIPSMAEDTEVRKSIIRYQ